MRPSASSRASDARSVKKTSVVQAFPSLKTELLFVFDYGDEWIFKVEFVHQGEKAAKVKYPRVVKSVGKAPEQYPAPEDDDLDEEPQEIRGYTFDKTPDGKFKPRKFVIKRK